MLLALLAAAPPALGKPNRKPARKTARKAKPNCDVKFIKEGSAGSSIFISFAADNQEKCTNFADDNTSVSYSGSKKPGKGK